MQVRLLKHWNGFRPHTIFADAGDGMANVLIRRGLAEPVEPVEPVAAEPANGPPEVCGSSIPPPRPKAARRPRGKH